MLKKILIAVTIIIVAGLIVLACYVFLEKQTVSESNLIRAVPVNTPLFLECRNYSGLVESLENNGEYWKELKNIDAIGTLQKQMRYLDTLQAAYPGLKTLLSSRPVVISMHLTGKNNISFLFLVSLTNEWNEEYISEIINNEIAGLGNISERSYDNSSIYDVKVSKTPFIDNFSFAFDEGMLIFSFSPILVEDALRQLRSGVSLSECSDFRKIAGTSGINVNANVYINYKTLPRMLALLIDGDHHQVTNSLSSFANWSELDLNLKQDMILLNGFTYAGDSVPEYMCILEHQDPVKFKMDMILPSGTSAFVLLGISDLKKFMNDRMKYLQDLGKYSEINEKLVSLEAKYGINIGELYRGFFEDEAGLIYTDINDLDIEQNSFIVIGTTSRSKAEEDLLSLLIAYARDENKSLSDFSSLVKIDNETSFPVYKFPFKGLNGLIFGRLFAGDRYEYFSFIDNYLVFGTSEKALGEFLHANILQKTLASDLAYNDFYDHLSDRSSFYFYTNISLARPLIRKFLCDDWKQELDSNFNTFKKFQSLAYQFFPGKEMTYNNLIIKYNPVVKEKPRTVWESKIDTIFTDKPKIVVNHTTNENEIFIQDQNNYIYLINYAGRVLWKQKIDGRIISDIYQVDIFKNKKLQYLFNTKNKIYIVDRLGNFVERFPVELRAGATNGLALFDYENNRDYRILIACDDKKIYAYDIEGNILKGWEFDKTEKFVYEPLQHFRVKDKDYIVFADSLKTYILDRKGEERVKVEKQFPKSKNNIFYLEKAQTPEQSKLITTDSDGNVVWVYLSGKVEIKKLRDSGPGHYFDYADVDGDGNEDYIYADGNELQVFDRKKNKLYSHEFDSRISGRPALYIFPNNNRKIGVVCADDQEIYLINSNGEILDGFPLKGSTMFSVGTMGSAEAKFNLFVGSRDGFLYNYEVQGFKKH